MQKIAKYHVFYKYKYVPSSVWLKKCKNNFKLGTDIKTKNFIDKISNKNNLKLLDAQIYVWYSSQFNHLLIVYVTTKINIDDLKTDIEVAKGNLQNTKRFFEAYKAYNLLMQLYKEKINKVTITGHSLSGLIAKYVNNSICNEHPEIKPYLVYCFNAVTTLFLDKYKLSKENKYYLTHNNNKNQIDILSRAYDPLSYANKKNKNFKIYYGSQTRNLYKNHKVPLKSELNTDLLFKSKAIKNI